MVAWFEVYNLWICEDKPIVYDRQMWWASYEGIGLAASIFVIHARNQQHKHQQRQHRYCIWQIQLSASYSLSRSEAARCVPYDTRMGMCGVCLGDGDAEY